MKNNAVNWDLVAKHISFNRFLIVCYKRNVHTLSKIIYIFKNSEEIKLAFYIESNASYTTQNQGILCYIMLSYVMLC